MAQSNILKNNFKCTCEILPIKSTTHHEFVVRRVTKKVRHREEQPLDEGGDLEILEVDDFDFREDDVRKGVFD
ncbi:hypothetical protein Goari_027442 [Gossypium aridum]|uniref:Uncharacterized protein n=1 Tax=Gossypium aridum TaxID=34290 RepID=A0A7J8YND2_GOSAI|nr:hypothetical protein [Gossypium aridum]